MSKIDLARRIVALNSEVTGEPGGIREAEKLANRETVDALTTMLEDATKAAAEKAAGAPEPPAEVQENALAREAGRMREDGQGFPDGARVRVIADGREGTTVDCSFLTGQPARLRSAVDLAGGKRETFDVGELEALAAPPPHDAWAAKPWLRPNVRVVLPALEPGESDEAPEGLPAERGVVGRIFGDAGTCIVTVDEEFRDGPEDDGARTVSIDDVELAPEPTLAGANAADRAAAHGVALQKLLRKLELAKGRAQRAQDEVTKLEQRIARERASAGRLAGGGT